MTFVEPSAFRAAELRRAMDASLHRSTCTVLDHRCPAWRSDRLVPGADGSGDDWPGARLLDYGAYFDLALATDLTPPMADAAVAHLRARLAGRPGPAALAITTLDPSDYTPAEIARMRRWWDTEPENAFGLLPVSAVEFERARELILAALARLGDAAPELDREFRILVRDIVVAHPDPAQRDAFGACSSFALWGGFVVDCQTNDTWPVMLRTLVHEAAHTLLFALAREGPLVENDPAARFASPVRLDPRPMDGIFHAAFVTARECLALEHLLAWHDETGALASTEEGEALRLLEDSAVKFWECVTMVRAQARLTPLGAAILADCEAYMTANFALDPA